MENIKVGDRFKPKQDLFRTEITVININDFRDPVERYGCTIKRWYGDTVEDVDDVYFVGDDFFNTYCERIED